MSDRYFLVEIEYGKYSSTSASRDTLEEAKAELVRQIAYYVECETVGVDLIKNVSVKELCSECNGRGTVVKRFKRRAPKDVRCPVCKGKNSEVVIL